VMKVYVLLTTACFLTYWLAGMNVFEALLHSLSTLSTGGFSPLPRGMATYQGLPIQLAVCFFMLCGAVAFPLYYRAGTDGWRRFAKDWQLRWLLILVAIGFTVATLGRVGFGAPPASLFHVVSALTTTGFNLTEPASWSSTGRALATFFMIVVEKTKDIGVLKSLGAPSGGIAKIFLGYGLTLGFVGSGVGMVMGLLIVIYINGIADGIGWLTGQDLFDPEIYYFDQIPTIITPLTIAWIVVGAMLIAASVTIRTL